MNDKKQLYKIEWMQDYIDWEKFVECIIERNLESSDMAEAKEVIANIMEM